MPIRPVDQIIKEVIFEVKLNNVVMDIIIKHKLLNYVIKNPKCASMYHLSELELEILKEWKKFHYDNKEEQEK